MNEVLKQRLVGALILVALGVVFWPIIFVQPGDTAIDQQQRSIPVAPGISKTPVSAPELTGLRASPELQVQPIEPAVVIAVKPPAKTVAPEPEQEPIPVPQITARSQTPAPLAMDSDGVPVAWILQVVSVSSADKAEDIRSQLLAMDQKAYIKKIPRDGKVLYRIYLGPKFERAKLEKMKPSIDSEFGVTSMIVRYVP
ncbi:MAG: DedD protein [Halioglobus sp.]